MITRVTALAMALALSAPGVAVADDYYREYQAGTHVTFRVPLLFCASKRALEQFLAYSTMGALDQLPSHECWIDMEMKQPPGVIISREDDATLVLQKHPQGVVEFWTPVNYLVSEADSAGVACRKKAREAGEDFLESISKCAAIR